MKSLVDVASSTVEIGMLVRHNLKYTISSNGVRTIGQAVDELIDQERDRNSDDELIELTIRIPR